MEMVSATLVPKAKAAEPAVDFSGMGAAENPSGEGHQDCTCDETDEGAQHDKEDDPSPFSREDEDAEPCLGDGRAGETGDECVGGAGGEAKEPGDDVPDNGADEAAHDHIDINDGWVD